MCVSIFVLIYVLYRAAALYMYVMLCMARFNGVHCVLPQKLLKIQHAMLTTFVIESCVCSTCIATKVSWRSTVSLT